ncbi:MAG: undecaprenyl/decaprenyl-phosphate alpha-N-acetylglucosaminyl 1-phosphate transferase [Lentisphaeria bacterium]|nr:undecaprenyl/decaprenyl-phosphate alpha-N-acetylglucosaminyl 1-phosphate transferase [Lentisphaeria bacterium]
MSWWHAYTAAALATAVFSACLTWVCVKSAARLGFVDTPLHEAHKQHLTPTPVMGGIAMCAAWLLALLAGLLCVTVLHTVLGEEIATHLPGLSAVSMRLLIISAGTVAITVLGAVDDRVSMKAWQKFLGQFLVAGCVAAWGVRLTAFCSWAPFTWALTTLWIMTVINALNFLDNMDGLTAGTSAIAAFLFGFIAAFRGQHFVSVWAALTFGAACGFLVFNKPKASIFMGDAGSHFLGFNLAVLGAMTTFYSPSDSQTIAPVLIPLFVLGLPLFDAVAVVIIRLRTGKPIYVGDNQHISHRFNSLGLTRPQSVLLVCLLSFTIGSGGIALLWLPIWGVILVGLQALAVLAVISIIQFYVPGQGSGDRSQKTGDRRENEETGADSKKR